MARPPEKGLGYFPLDISVFDDDKLFDIQNEFGPLGEVIYLRLLCLIYKNGYYYEFSSMDKLCAMLIKSIGNRWARGKKSVAQVILMIAECNLLSPELMQIGVLTSAGIQRRYLKATERRRIDISKYWLLEETTPEALESVPKTGVNATETEVNATETEVNAYNNATKENKRKINKTIYSESAEKGSFDTDSFFRAALKATYGDIIEGEDES